MATLFPGFGHDVLYRGGFNGMKFSAKELDARAKIEFDKIKAEYQEMKTPENKCPSFINAELEELSRIISK